jgi:hypothetical protein
MWYDDDDHVGAHKHNVATAVPRGERAVSWASEFRPRR